MQVAGMGRRIGAWILDFIFASLFAIVPLFIAFAIGAVALNRQAMDMYDEYATDPWAHVTAPLLDVNMSLIAVAVVIYLGFMALYFAGTWIGWGGTPGQKIVGLRVVDASTGRKLSVVQALLRWAMVAGASQALFGLFMARMFDWMSRTPANAYVAQSGSSVRAEMDSGLGALAVLTWWGTVIWMVILLVVTAIDNMKRGWHDKVAGSVVLGPLQAPAYTPTAAWPSQATGAPPAAPGYPPSAYPGYPGYPGYPPQAQPPAPPPPPPPAAPVPPPAETPVPPPSETPAPKRTRTPKSKP